MSTVADRKVPSSSPHKVAMSRALGAAFLNHQVEQLEKSISTNSPTSSNWRERRKPSGDYRIQSPPSNAHRVPMSPGIKVVHRRKGGDAPSAVAKEKPEEQDVKNGMAVGQDAASSRSSTDRDVQKKDADIVVVDASVLVHALYQVKKWCREGRQEILIVPLEALNTLDLLKKGTTPLAQRARAASRILEAQVGTNQRVRVQRDDAYVLWDKIIFDDGNDDESESKSAPSPEWVRRTICCARWEVENAKTTINSDGNGRPIEGTVGKLQDNQSYKVILAVLSNPTNGTPLYHTSKSTDSSMTAVPPPAPSLPHVTKFEVRSSGVLVTRWAQKAGINILPVEPTLPGRGGNGDDEERHKRPHPPHPGTRGRRGSATDHAHKACLVERPPAVKAMMDMVSQPTRVVRVLARGEKLEPDP